MTPTPAVARRDHGSLLVMLAVIGLIGVINWFVAGQRTFLNLYYLPAVFGAYALGRRKGVYLALLACAVVFTIANVRGGSLEGDETAAYLRWLDLGTWGLFLVLTSYIVGSLYDLQEAQIREIRHAYAGVLEMMAKFIDSVDRYTENHSRRVAAYSMKIARAMGLSDVEIEDIRVGAYLHDIGKVDVSTELLTKAAGLSCEEYAALQRHVENGEQLVRSMGGILRHVIPMVAYHHERFDGAGYKGLVGENIPLGARIISVADTYDAIVTRRTYRDQRSHQEAVEIIQAESGKQFDPRVVSAFLQSFPTPPGDTEEDEASPLGLATA
ncbi:MAG: HD domain-containing protein [Candidatus Eisenbacteria bacterium]|uniref:HD domain-containing protein n=1 Tax=Eiseniibacteriota bacterium TaxID=2212470 RepID=A0A538TLA5_UNCEI|nr:MAG: HD domain-containing protein [Candidatus Eisenbacteria bacterium]